MKYKIGLTDGRVSQKPFQTTDLFKFATSKDNSFYMVPFPSLFKGTGLHLSFHPSGVSHLRTTNPKISVDIRMDELIKLLSLDAYKISFEHFLRLPRSGTPALIAIISDRQVQECIYKIGANNFLIDVWKLFNCMTLAAVKDTLDLPFAIPKLRSLGHIKEGDNIVITPTELNEFSIFHDRSSHKIQDLEYLLPSEKEYIRKFGGYFFTIEKSIEGGYESFFHSPLFKPLFEPMQEFMNKLDRAGIKPTNLSTNSFENVLKFEHILQEKRVLELS